MKIRHTNVNRKDELHGLPRPYNCDLTVFVWLPFLMLYRKDNSPHLSMRYLRGSYRP